MSCKYETEWCKNHVHCQTCEHYEIGKFTTTKNNMREILFQGDTALMNDKEIIKEMAKEIFNTCAWRFGKPDDYKEVFNDIAEDLTKLNYRKLPEDSVVLSNDNAEELANLIVTSPQMQSVMSDLIKAWQKEAAEKIIRDLMNIEIEDVSWTKNKKFVDYLNKIVGKLEELAKQFGVEI